MISLEMLVGLNEIETFVSLNSLIRAFKTNFRVRQLNKQLSCQMRKCPSSCFEGTHTRSLQLVRVIPLREGLDNSYAKVSSVVGLVYTFSYEE